MFLRRCTILLILLLPLSAIAQIEESVEQWIAETENEQAAGDMNDLLLHLNANPVNINDTSAVASLPFITPFQLKALKNYIILHGQLMSIKELLFVPLFDSATIATLEPYIIVEPHTPRNRWRLADGRHSIITSLGGTSEIAEGYRNGHYEGDNLHALLCYHFNLNNHLSIRLTIDKDPAEAWGKNNYYGYHVMLNDVGKVERLIVGRYNLQFGQGLTLWTGFAPFSLVGISPLRFGAGVRQASAFYEEGYQEGLAARINIGHGFHLSAFGSHINGETLAGGHLDYRRGNLIVGLTAAHITMDDSLSSRDYTYNQNRFRGQNQTNLGVDAIYQLHRMTLYGEAAIGENRAPAAIAGMILKVDSRNSIGLSYRYHDPFYHNIYAQGYAIGNTQGEQGVSLDAENKLPFGMTLLTSLDLHNQPILRYADYAPSAGNWMRMQLSKPWGQYIVTNIRFSHRLKERNIPNIDSTLYLGEQIVRQQWQGEAKGTFGRWSISSRLIGSLFEGENGIAQYGWLVNLSARYSHRQMRVATAIAYYDVDDYYARIYLSESTLQYAWSMPALYGRGWRGYLLLQYRFGHHLTLAGKYTLSYLPDQEYIGSGDSRTKGPVRQMWLLQVRTTF